MGLLGGGSSWKKKQFLANFVTTKQKNVLANSVATKQKNFLANSVATKLKFWLNSLQQTNKKPTTTTTSSSHTLLLLLRLVVSSEFVAFFWGLNFPNNFVCLFFSCTFKMGNYMACMCWRKKLLKKKKKKKKKSTEEMSMSHGMMRRRTTASLEDELIQQQAIAMALHQQHKAQLRFERSLSHRDLAASTRRSYSSVGKPGTSSGRLEEYTRSASTRPRHSNDVLLDPQQLNLNNGIKVTNSCLLTSRASSLL